MGVVEFVSELIWSLERKAVKFSRKKSKREQLEEVATWNYNHMGIGPYNDVCVVCGQRGVNANDPCLGPPATQQARRRLEQLRRSD